jgi:hypothetical protein
MLIGRARVRLLRCLVCTVASWGVLAAGCAEDPTDFAAPGLAGTEGRLRYVVTVKGPAADLSGFRELAATDAAAAADLTARKRREAAAAHAALDEAVRSVSGRVVNHWWTTNQVTIEVAASSLATVRAVEGVLRIDPDHTLQ